MDSIDLLKRHPKVTLILLNIFFAFLAVVGQVGENVSLPLWANAASSNCSTHRGNNTEGNMDSYFILSFGSFVFVIIFGVLTLIATVVRFESIKQSVGFPQWQLMLIGVCDAFNGVLVVFAASPSRTAPFLQAILGNIVIPLTILFRVIILRKKPTVLKVIAAGVVLLGLILSLIPVITGLDKDSADDKQDWLRQSTVKRILWPLCFMLGFVPATLMNVFEEMSLKDTRKVNLFYLLFWTSLYQFITVMIFFWLDVIPIFGYADNIHEFGENYWFSLQCLFGQDTCDYVPGLRGFSFVFMYTLAYIGGGLLLRYAEGATYLAIVQSLVTPLGALFWSVYNTDKCGNFFWEPHADSLTYFSIGGIVLIVPAILLYNISIDDIKKRLFNRGTNYKHLNGPNIADPKENTPLLN